MENSAKVFFSDITRVGSNHKNALYDLLNIVPAVPLKINNVKINTCDYSPKTDKYYIPKKRSPLKVRTVRDIRKTFEQDVYTHLTTDLEMQQNVLFKKIRRGFSREDGTKKLATKMLKGDTPISRSTWQMLINLNPEHHKHPRQFVLWNGKYVQVNGSYGGNKKNICNYDLASKPQCLPMENHKTKCLKRFHEENRKKRLLRNSLVVKLKPGPLCKKQFLDNSHQKYHVGNIELVNLPKPGLDVQPKYGTTFESSVSHFLNNLRKEDGTISQKWAELAVSVLGTLDHSKPVQLNRDCITFDLAYKYNQNRLLMRRDVDNSYVHTSEAIGTGTLYDNKQSVEINGQFEIKDIVNKIMDAVEINIIQEKLFTQEQELKIFPFENVSTLDTVTHVKDKSKRKFGELDRLDVTVITLPETEERNLKRRCGKAYCSLGCICASLDGTYNLKQHCGRVECMFNCKCDFLKYKSDLIYTGTGCTDLFPGLLNIDNEINLNLTKEELKFHQTVIVTGEKRIFLKGEKRNWKTPKKYADFYSNMSLKHENREKQNLSIVAFKLNCDNVEPWCMVHQLYKCFCKGKFTDSCTSVLNETVNKESLSKDSISNIDSSEENSDLTHDVSNTEEFKLNFPVKKSKMTASSQTKSNKIHTSRMGKATTHANNITNNLNYDDPKIETQGNRFSVKDTGNIPRSSSVSEFTNLSSENGMLTRHAIRKLNQQNSNSEKNYENNSDSKDSDNLDFWDSTNMSSSRTTPYEGRKYSNGYYKNTNDKILTMEKNDKRLRERLTFLHSKCCQEDIIVTPNKKTKDDAASLLELLCDANKKGEELIPQSKRKRLSNETKLVSWLESNYKMYKQRSDHGIIRNALEPPQHGKVALHSWDFILTRYRERKNLFLVSRQKPFRIFMAVNTENSFFDNCIDINDIRFADLHKYPQTVKNLLINATDLKDNFCILRGLSCCWELIGSVTKVNETDEQVAGNGCTSQMNIESSVMSTLAERDQNDSVAKKTVGENSKTNNVDTLDVFNLSDSEANDLILENTEHEDTETLALFNHNLDERNSLVENTEQDEVCVFNRKKTVKSKQKLLLDVAEQNDIQSYSKDEFESNTGCSDDTGSSKWFVMTIENDFSEIRFFRKGFFVKYGSILNAINVARLSGKTVRLSSKKCIEQPEAPQFGIYAIPNDSEYCVFVGPYEMEDTLGIETIKTILDVRRLKRTRGFWITTNKVDNLKVVENPLSFVSLTNNRINSTSLDTHFVDELNKDQQVNPNQQKKSDQKERPKSQESLINKIEESNKCSPLKKIKVVKPIKIRKTNGFYHLASDGVLKKISLQYPQNTTSMPVSLKNSLNVEDIGSITSPTVSNNLNLNPIPETLREPFAEASSSAASQIKISAVFSTKNDDVTAKRANHERGMFILKPEEINRKLVQNKLTEMSLTSGDENNSEISDVSLRSDLENVTTEKQTEWCPLNDDIYVISDDENYKTNAATENCKLWTNVWIECTNIPDVGWIAGIRNLNNLISFKLPGSEYSDFYPEEEAFSNINLELRRRVVNLSDLEERISMKELEWRVYDTVDHLKGKEMNPEELYPDYEILEDNDDSNSIQDI